MMDHDYGQPPVPTLTVRSLRGYLEVSLYHMVTLLGSCLFFWTTEYSAYQKAEKMLAKYVSNGYTPDTSKLKLYLLAISADERFELLKKQYGWWGYTALYKAAERGDTEVMRCLLEMVEPQKRYMLLKIQDPWWGGIPLHVAAMSGITAVMRCMLRMVKPKNQIQLLDIPNKYNNTALDVAGGEETVQLIRQYRKNAEREIAAPVFLSENDVEWIFNQSRHGISSAIPSYNREIACYPIARYPDNQNPLLPLSLQKKLAEMSPREYLSAVLRELSLEERESLMIDEKQRRNTFLVNWPHDSNLSGVRMAPAGLYCVDDYDRVQCVFCRGSLHKWEAEDNPMTEHAKLFPFCRFVKGLECGNKQYKSDRLLADELKNITRFTMPEMKKNRDGSVSTNSNAFGISTTKGAVIKYAPYETRKNTYGRWPAANVIRPEPLCEADPQMMEHDYGQPPVPTITANNDDEAVTIPEERVESNLTDVDTEAATNKKKMGVRVFMLSNEIRELVDELLLQRYLQSTKYSAYEKVEKMLAEYVSNPWYTPDTSELKQYLQAISADERFELLKKQYMLGDTSLTIAAERGDTEVMRCLLELVEPQKRYKLLKIQGWWWVGTPFHVAASSGRTDVMKCMLEMVEPEIQIQLLDIPNWSNKTSLDVAKGEETVQLIRQYRASAVRETAVGRWLRWLMDDEMNPLAFGHSPTEGALHRRQSNVNNDNPSAMTTNLVPDNLKWIFNPSLHGISSAVPSPPSYLTDVLCYAGGGYYTNTHNPLSFERQQELDEMSPHEYIAAIRNLSSEELTWLMSVETRRRKTFLDNWPHAGNISGEKMAQAGFYHSGDNDGSVRCVFCGVVIHSWDVNDNPMDEHTRYSSSCRFLQGLRSGIMKQSTAQPAENATPVEEGWC